MKTLKKIIEQQKALFDEQFKLTDKGYEFSLEDCRAFLDKFALAIAEGHRDAVKGEQDHSQDEFRDETGAFNSGMNSAIEESDNKSKEFFL